MATISLAAGLTRSLETAGIQVVSVSIGDFTNRATWNVQFGPDVTQEQIDAAAVIVATYEPSMASPKVRLRTFKEDDSGQSTPNPDGTGSVDPSVEHVLVPEPPMGYVSIPGSAAIQCDSDRLYVTCHILLNRTGNPVDPTIEVDWMPQENVGDRAILGATIRLTPAALVGGEYFFQMPVFPIVHGFNILASWSHATPSSAIRTRCTTYEVPIEQFDFSRVRQMVGPFPRLTTV